MTRTDRYTTICNLSEAIWLERNEPDYIDITDVTARAVEVLAVRQ